jgi:hypothetical protein
MVEKTLNEDSLGKITYDKEISLLTLEWSEATKDMIASHFQGILYLLAGYALQKKSIKIFIDARKFLFHPSDELIGPWRTKNISPLYDEAGVKKFAFLFPPGSPIPPTNGQNMPDEKFPTGFFSSESELRKWLSN